MVFSFPNRKRCAGLRFGARRDFDFPPDLLEPTKKTPSVFLDLSREGWQICAKNCLSLHPLLPLPLGEVSERSEDGERVYRDCQDPLSRLRRQLSQRESQAWGLPCLSLWERWLSEAKTERVHAGSSKNPLSRLRQQLSRRESQGASSAWGNRFPAQRFIVMSTLTLCILPIAFFRKSDRM